MSAISGFEVPHRLRAFIRARESGIIVLAAPFESLGTLALVGGFCLIFIGVSEIVTAFGIRSATKKGTSAPAVESIPPTDPPAEPPAPPVAAPAS